MKKTNSHKELLKISNSLINQITECIIQFESVRDHSRDLTDAELEFLKVLNFSLDLFAKTQLLQADENNYIPEVRDDFGKVMKNVYKYPLMQLEITDRILEKLKNINL